MNDQSIKDRIRSLVNKSLAEQLSSEEREELDSLLVDERHRIIVQEALLQSFYQDKELVDMSLERSEMVWRSIKALDASIKTEAKVRKIAYWKWTAVASIVLLVLVPLLMNISNNPLSVIFVKQDTVSSTDITEQAVVSRDRSPAKKQATLTTFEGTVFQLDQLNIGKTVQIEGLEITKRNSGDLVFRFQEASGTERRIAQGMNTITTPRGGIYHIVLPDGSEVRLNASSKLSFPTSFAANERLVFFEGEGYFDIATDSTRRFIVRTTKHKQTQDVTVFGTEFNINAYPENDGILTTLVEGCVEVSQQGTVRQLAPMQQARVDHGQIEVSVANLDINLAWKNNMFYFADEPLVNVMAQIGRWYDIDIHYTGEVPNVRLWGQVSREKKLSEMLEILRQTNDVRFEIKGKEVTVMN